MGRERGLSEDLAKLSVTIAEWRAEHGGRGRKIPEELWTEAVRVARTDGTWLTAKTTRLKYGALKERIARAEGEGASAPGETTPPAIERRGYRRRAKRRKMRGPSTGRRRGRRKAEFVEVSAAQLVGAPSTAGTVVEVVDKAGVRMILRFAREANVDDVARLISAFRRCET